MAYYLQGEVHREFVFDCNEYSNQTVPVIQNSNNTPSYNEITGKWQGTGISVYNGVGKFRFSLSDDLYVRKTALKWASIPMVMNTLPEDVTSLLQVNFLMSEIDGPNPIDFVTIPVFFNLNTRKTNFPWGQAVSQAIDSLSPENYSQLNDVPRFMAPDALAQKITDILNYFPEHLDIIIPLVFPNVLTANAYPVPPANSILFAFSPTANGYTLTWPSGYQPGAGVNQRWCIQGVALGFVFLPPNSVFVPGNDAAAPPVYSEYYHTQLPSPSNFRSVNRFASYTLGTTFADLGGFEVAGYSTFVKNVPDVPIGPANASIDPKDHAFAYCVIDVLLGLYQGTPGVPPVYPPAAPTPTTYQIVSNAQFSAGGPPYLLLHSSLMQSSKIKPMISAYHYPTSRYAPYSNTAFPWQGERSSTVIATIPIIQSTGVSVMGKTYYYRHDSEGDYLQEMVPDKTRDVELWLTYPDGSDVFFYTQFPVFALNIVDNNEAI